MDKCDVLVVGGGPTGLLLAAELARYGLKCRIIDKNLTPNTHSRALAIQPRTLEILDFLGIAPSLIKKGHKLSTLNPMSGKSPLGRIDFSQLSTPFPFILSIPQSLTEEILNDHLETFHLKVERGFELVGLEEGKEITAHIQNPSGEESSLKAKWVVGCDGAHSFVRKYLNLSFIGKSFPQVFSLADVEIEWKYPHEEGFAFFTPTGVLAAIPLPNEDHYRLIFQLPRCQVKKGEASLDNLEVDAPPPALEEVEQLVKEVADPKALVYHPKWLANFHVNSRLVKRYQVGNIFLAGDAAHIHSPIGGQGMNTGLQDAFNLGWKIALAHQGHSLEPLKSYHEERHAFARQLLKGTEVGTQIATLKKKWEVILRNTIASSLLHIPFFHNRLINALTQLSLTYPRSPFIVDKGLSKGPKAGSRLPNCNLKKREVSFNLYALLKNPHVFYVLIFVGDQFKNWDELANELESLSLPVKVILIAKTPREASREIFLDPQGEAHESFGVNHGGCYIARPDTYIGFKQGVIQPKAIKDYLAKFG